LPESFLAAAAEGRKKLKILSRRRRRERRRLTPLFIIKENISETLLVEQTPHLYEVFLVEYN
jgi:hypothetical protein